MMVLFIILLVINFFITFIDVFMIYEFYRIEMKERELVDEDYLNYRKSIIISLIPVVNILLLIDILVAYIRNFIEFNINRKEEQ